MLFGISSSTAAGLCRVNLCENIFSLFQKSSFGHFTKSASYVIYSTTNEHFNKTLLKKEGKKEYSQILTAHFHETSILFGRYGHRLVKKWEYPEYTTEPLKVFRTGGRLPTKNWKNEIVPGKVWTSKLGGGLPRKWHWVDTQRMTAEEVEKESYFQEKVIKIIEDDNRSGHIALVVGPKRRRWVLCTESMKVGNLITNCAKSFVGGVEFKDGDAYPLSLIPLGTKVCSVEFVPGKGAQIARSAGTSCTVSRKSEHRTVLLMPSKREIHVDSKCVAVIGVVSNAIHNTIIWGSAKQRRAYGLRPSTGRHHKLNCGRWASSGYVRPPIVIPDQKVLQRSNEIED